MESPPKTDIEALKRILKQTSKAKLAEHLGVTRQLTSRWESIPPKYAEQVATMLNLPIGHVVPELVHRIHVTCGKEVPDKIIGEMVRIFE